MISQEAESAVNDAIQHGQALLKFISPNDAGTTGGHQCGFYLPKEVWEMYSPHPPHAGSLSDEDVEITWQNGLVTQSRIVWYGQGTRREYRLTRFGRGFPYLNAEAVGNLLVLIPIDHHNFIAYVLDNEEDIDSVQAALGVEAFTRWGVFHGGARRHETEDDCIERRFDEFAATLREFPTGRDFSDEAVKVLEHCLKNFARLAPDDALMAAMDAEYGLFRSVERRLCHADISRKFANMDDFLGTASRIMNRRKARAGRSLENHVDRLLTRAGIPHEMRPQKVKGRPDIVIPSAAAYLDKKFPADKLFVVGIKTTCKDRWRQVLKEGPRVSTKHLITIQPSISVPQLKEMKAAGISLVVPEQLNKKYPAERPSKILTIEGFAEMVRKRLD